MNLIFSRIVDWHLTKGYGADVKAIGQLIVSATMAVYKNAMTNLLPTPAKSHYLFNLRDFVRVIQGVLLSNSAYVSDADTVKRLWTHEVCILCVRISISVTEYFIYQNRWQLRAKVIGDIRLISRPHPHGNYVAWY